jgi:hypothetical protein
LRFDGRAQQQRDVLELGPLPRVGERGVVGDELRVRLHHRVEDPQPIGAQRRVSVASTMASASTGGLTSVAPENSTTSAPCRAKYARHADDSVAIVFPLKSFADWNGESSGAASTSAPCQLCRRSDP